MQGIIDGNTEVLEGTRVISKGTAHCQTQNHEYHKLTPLHAFLNFSQRTRFDLFGLLLCMLYADIHALPSLFIDRERALKR